MTGKPQRDRTGYLSAEPMRTGGRPAWETAAPDTRLRLVTVHGACPADLRAVIVAWCEAHAEAYTCQAYGPTVTVFATDPTPNNITKRLRRSL